MEISEILRQFERATGVFARAAVEEAVARRDEVAPELLGILEETVERPEQIDADRMSHQYAFFLLAQFRDTRAYPYLLRFALLPGDLQYSLGGDFVTEDLGRVLASVCGGDVTGIQSLIENEEADEWARSAALKSLVALVAAGQKTREEVLSYFASLFRGKLTRQWSHVWDSLVARCCDLYPEDLIGDIEQAYEDGLVDPGFIGFDDVEHDIVTGKERVLARLAGNPHLQLVEDTVREMEWWACFRHGPPSRDNWNSARSNIVPGRAGALSPVRTTPKIGRNEPCPCGSGKKYKKCCGG
jgi:hypothetical protein